MRRVGRSRAFLALLALILAPISASSQPESPGKSAGKAADAPKPKETLSDRFEGMTFRAIGPYRGGRVTAVTGVPGQPSLFYMGATGGGVWKTTDGGSNWEVLSDKDFRTGSVGAIAVAPSDPNVIYVGMGESPIRGNVSHGDGVYKSTDGGRSWKNMGLSDARQIARVRIHPRKPDLVFVAAQGHVWGPNAERGIFRSEDGGTTWKKVLFVDEKTGASDLAMDPTNPRILYAGFWQVVRRPWELVSGGPGSSLWKSTDGGETWKKLTKKLPEGTWGRVGVAASASRPGRVYAFVEAKHGGLFRSDDYGESWTHVNDEHKIRERAWYYSWVIVDPKDAEHLFLPNVSLHESRDGGKSFRDLPVLHGDAHDLWIDPDDPRRMILGDDGGATITYNGGKTWSSQDNQPTGQFYRVAVDQQFPYKVYGSQQDNSNVVIPSGVAGERGIGRTDWHSAGGGEAGWMAPHPTDPNIVYAGEYMGQITRYDHRTREERQIGAWPQLGSGRPTSGLRYRFQWNAPILVSRHDPSVIYHASQILLRSTDEGQSWQEISPDLTRNDRSKQGLSGGPITTDVTGVEWYDTIFALAESPVERGVLWAGTDDGLVWVSRDDARTWQNVTPKGIPEWIQINSIEASPKDRGTAYLAATRYKFDDFRPYLYKTSDYGKTWTKIVAGIPDTAFTRVIREDPVRHGLLYAGTETGLYVSFDDGALWQPFQRNLPHTPITDLAVNGDLVVATQGRSFWILDDLTPLREWKDSVAQADAFLFKPRPTVRIRIPRLDPDDPPVAEGRNMPEGVVVDYWLKAKPGEKEKVTLEFLDGDTVLRTFSSEKPEKADDLKKQAELEEERERKDKPLEPDAGVNRFVWDLRILKPVIAPKVVFNEGTTSPPRVAPGTYKVRLTAGGTTYAESFEVRPHPAGFASAADLKAQYDLLAKIRDRLSDTQVALLKARDVRSQVRQFGDRAERLGKGDALKSKASSLADKLTAVEEKLTNPKIVADLDDLNYEPKLDHDWVYLASMVASGDAKPTAAELEYYELLRGQLDAVEKELAGVLEKDLAQFNREVDELKIGPVTVAPVVPKP